LGGGSQKTSPNIKKKSRKVPTSTYKKKPALGEKNRGKETPMWQRWEGRGEEGRVTRQGARIVLREGRGTKGKHYRILHHVAGE